jgi:hypothetical protein
MLKLAAIWSYLGALQAATSLPVQPSGLSRETEIKEYPNLLQVVLEGGEISAPVKLQRLQPR